MPPKRQKFIDELIALAKSENASGIVSKTKAGNLFDKRNCRDPRKGLSILRQEHKDEEYRARQQAELKLRLEAAEALQLREDQEHQAREKPAGWPVYAAACATC